MSRLYLLCILLTACDPLPAIPVPLAPVEPAGLAPPPAAAVADKDTGSSPVLDTNRAPVITRISVEPGTPRTMDDLAATVEGEDPDGDHIRYEYAWFVNAVEIRGQRQSKLPHTYYAKGDKVQLHVLAKDRDAETEGLSPLIIVRNTPPDISTKPGSLRSVDGFQIQADDIDSDSLRFHLEGHPDGMTIDASSGTLSYQGSERAKAGDYAVNVVVEDPDGGSAKWAFGISVAAGSAGTKPAAAQEESAKRRRGWNPGDADEQEEEE